MKDKKTEALKLALESLEDRVSLNKWQKARDAVRQALEEQPAQQQEPVAWRNAALRVGEDLCSVGPFGYYDMTAEQWLDWALSVVTVHAPQARKPWIGLTDEEIDLLEDLYAPPVHPDFVNDADHCTELIRHVEAKLKEKNT